MRMRRKILPCLAGLLLLLGLCGAALSAGAEDVASVSMPEVVRGYSECSIKLVSPGDGEAEMHLYDALNNPWLIRREQITSGENTIIWDGLAANQERLFAGPYHFDIFLHLKDGREMKVTAKFQVNATVPTLMIAIPSSDILYLDHSEKWFIECCVSVECLVEIRIRDQNGKQIHALDTVISNEDGEMIRWAGMIDARNRIEPGNYTVSCRSSENPSYEHVFPLKVEEKNPLSREVTVTGPVLPERGMSDEEIWEIMMKPSVVINANGSKRRFDLHAAPKTASKAVASLRCALQGLEILEINGPWARLVAWDHRDGHRAEGYFLVKKLTVEAPNPHYGLLVDKRDQTMTVFQDGKRIGTIPVSTGKVVGYEKYRETPAGAFLTDVRIGPNFAQDGLRYEYPLRYDVGNIIHGLGYTRQGRVRDYSQTLPYLGQKASHGCIRVSSFLEEGEFLNVYWLWTHLPYHTRVIVLDDAEPAA